MRLEFSKMHGLGNDFMVIDAINQAFEPATAQIRDWANRRTGVGFDQLLLVEAADQDGVDFRYRIFNADGSEVEQCGNGARCFARFVRDRGLTGKDEIVVSTQAGIITLLVQADGQITVDMGRPVFEPAKVPFDAPAQHYRYAIEVADESLEIGVVSMGNPHAVTVVNHVESAPVAELGPLIEHHERFPNRVNAGFMEIIDRGHARLRVYERGAGETMACGTGACAAMVVGHSWDLLDDEAKIELPGGTLVIRWPNKEDSVLMTGPATHVYDGVIEI